MKTIYLDNAGTTKISERALKAYVETSEEFFGNPSSLHSVGQRAKEILEDAREKIAKCLNAEAREIYFTSGGSESDNQALRSCAEIGKRKGKKHVISTNVEHHAVLHTLEQLKKEGFEIELLPVDGEGLITAEQVKNAIREDTCLVSVMFANNEIGSIMPISEIGAVCREKGVYFHTDAVQAVGHIGIDVKESKIDLLSISAHKFHGPKGIGVLYAKKGIPLTPLIRGGAQENNKRAGTENLPAIVAMQVALQDACGKIGETEKRLKPLRDALVRGLSKIPHSVLNGPREKRLFNNVNFCFEGIEGEGLLLLLNEYGICASSGSACTSGSLDPSHVLLAIGREHEIAHGSLRLSLGEDTTEEDVKTTIEKVGEVVAYLRNMSPVWRDKTNGKQPFIL